MYVNCCPKATLKYDSVCLPTRLNEALAGHRTRTTLLRPLLVLHSLTPHFDHNNSPPSYLVQIGQSHREATSAPFQTASSANLSFRYHTNLRCWVSNSMLHPLRPTLCRNTGNLPFANLYIPSNLHHFD